MMVLVKEIETNLTLYITLTKTFTRRDYQVNIKHLLLGSIAAVALTACVTVIQPPTESPELPVTKEDSHAVHWSYKGEEGPGHWGHLDPSFAACDAGKSQSPVDIAGTEVMDLPNVVFHYKASDVYILNNGHTVQVNYDSGSYIELDGQRYDLLQYHYHAPSEHTIDGHIFAAELHIVHKDASGRLAVVGILLEEGSENAAFQPLLHHLPAQKSAETKLDIQINAADFLPAVQTTYRYSGSLTTPPCTEGVSWLVMTSPLQVSAEQIAAFTNVFEGNNRPVQPLHSRSLLEDSTP
jgi:carbonic anhydrase